MSDAGRRTETAVLGGGCFWCLEAVFDQLEGVQSVESGYAGGNAANPTYEAVCSGETGHAEVVKIDFDPAVLSFRVMARLALLPRVDVTRKASGLPTGQCTTSSR